MTTHAVRTPTPPPASRRAAVRVAREHGRLAHVVEVEVEEDEPLEADARAAVGRHAVAHRLDVRLERGADVDALGRDGRLEHRGVVDPLRYRGEGLGEIPEGGRRIW